MSPPWRHGVLAFPIFAAIALLLPDAADAHKPSDSYLTLRPAGEGTQRIDVRWDIAVRDLDHALGLDGDGDGAVTWGETRARREEIVGYALARLRLATAAGACRLTAAALETVEHSDGVYLVLPLTARCPSTPDRLTLSYALFLDLDLLHRGIVRLDDGSDTTLVVAPGDGPRLVALTLAGATAPAAAAVGFAGFVGEGVKHIWGGLDHVLFLIALLLPSVLARGPDGGGTRARWIPVPAIRPALGDVARIVTAFTAAHSLTLSLAALGVVSVPARLVEPAIAASVALAAVNNVWPLFGPDRWVVAFALGLLHGFGFSSVLADAGLGGGRLARALVGFNLGVEVGQLCIVAAFVPAAFALRRTSGYRRLALVGGSLAITGISLVWIVQRIVIA